MANKYDINYCHRCHQRGRKYLVLQSYYQCSVVIIRKYYMNFKLSFSRHCI